jgi:hypothetical protein
MNNIKVLLIVLMVLPFASNHARSDTFPISKDYSQLYNPRIHNTHMVNSLWIEVPKDRQF